MTKEQAREAYIKFCRSSATMADVAREDGVDEETMRDIVCAQCSPRYEEKSSREFRTQVQNARAAYLARGMKKTAMAGEPEKRLAIWLCTELHFSIAAVARAFERDAYTVRKWVNDYNRRGGVFHG